MNIFQKNFRKQLGKTFHRTSLSVLAATLATAPFISTLEAIAAPSVPQIVAQVPQDWQTGVKLLKLLDNSGNLSSIGILFDVLNKPNTNYANVVYQLYVRRAGEWREVYTNSGARLLSKQAGKFFPPVEVISLSSLSERISLDDIYNGDLKAITSVRYDLPNGIKDARFEIEEIKSFSSITTVTASEVIARRTSTTTISNTSGNTILTDRDLGISNDSQISQTTTTQTTTTQTVQTQQMKPIIVTQNDDDEDDDYDCDASDRRDYRDYRRDDDKDRKEHRDNRRTDNKDRSNGHDNRRTDDKNGGNIHYDNRRADRRDRDDDDKDSRRTDSKNCKYRDGVEQSKKNPHRGHFSLAVLQSPQRLSQVIARISLKSKRPNGFLKERFVGDYRFTVNQRATFIRGLNPGDRIVVRLFDLQNRPLGYTEVQLLKNFAAISLVLPSDPLAYGTLRTVAGIDSQRIGRIDRDVKTYDYFTQITTTTVVTQTVARFLTTSQGISTSLFNVGGLPPAPTQCTYTNAFSRGEQSLIERTVSVFTRDMPPVMQVLPGQLSSLIPINDSQSTFDVVRKMLDLKDLIPNGSTLF
ncbi:hypothetical protein [Pseudanabaena yagii]|uniref:Uncharacterized protein n=1 Tax=Pseudanabaena yagii GIHE-NHR1 TaxID=2722753 RepID=A0ABX1LPC5_9CYAN|nr:hypothetical protein [Pseudanabaena yagii]NMF57163.1 hypothetical protein [Pseudanabaena yagii GIHE-NHR1]